MPGPFAHMRAVLANFRLHRGVAAKWGDGKTVPRIAWVFAALALAACGDLPTAPAPSAGYRTARTPIYSTAGLNIARMVGTWQQVAGFGAAKSCPQHPALQVSAGENGAVQVVYDLCLGGMRARGAGAMTSAGAQGRYRLPGLVAPIWVLWIDEGDRSIALGTPDGSFGAVLSKDAIPADRLRASREVLAWNSYDLTRFYQN